MARVRAFAEPTAAIPAATVTPITDAPAPMEQPWPFPVEEEAVVTPPPPAVEAPKPAPVAAKPAAPKVTKAAPPKPVLPAEPSDRMFSLLTDDLKGALELFMSAPAAERMSALDDVEMRITVIRAVLGTPS